MSFHHTARNIKIGHEGGVTTLEAELRDKGGDYHHRKIRLDDHIGNTDGWFIWGRGGFTHTASNVTLEHTEWGPKLCADLRALDGGSKGRQGLLLGDKIGNNDGHFKFTGP